MHGLYRTILYDRLPPGRRLEPHRRIAESEEAAWDEHANEIASELAHHFQNAQEKKKAIHYLTVAGEQAIRRAAHADAIGSLAAAIDLLSSLADEPDRVSKELYLQIILGGAFTAIKGFASPEVKRAYARAHALSKGLSEPLQLAAPYGLWVHYFTSGEIGIARELAENECFRLAETLQDPAIMLQAHLMLGGTLYHVVDFATARVHLDQSLALYDARIHRNHAFIYGQDPGTIGSLYAGLVLWCLGFPDQALKKLNEALSFANELQYPLTSAFANGFAARLHQARGEVEASRARAEAAIRPCFRAWFPAPLRDGKYLSGLVPSRAGISRSGH